MVQQVKRAACLVGAIIVFWLAIALPVWAGPPDVKARAAVLIDAKTGQVLYDKRMHDHNPPASTTKIMTAILAIESGRLDEETKVSPRSASTRGSSLYLYPGQVISLRELVTGLLLRSGNDAAVALAEHLSGSVDSFVDNMNYKANLLGAANTHFRNPHGLSAPGHYSSAYDLAILARHALSNPTFAEIVGTKETSIEWLDRRGREKDINLRNTNRLLWMLEEADGVKTGTTDAAGPCLVSSATRGNHKLIAVVLHDHSRWYDSMQLLKYGFDTYDLYEYADREDILASIPVQQGLAEMVDAVTSDHAALVVKQADYSKVTVEVELPEKITAPVYRGQKIGEVVFFIEDKAVKTVDIIAAGDVGERTLTKVFMYNLLRIFRLFTGWGLL